MAEKSIPKGFETPAAAQLAAETDLLEMDNVVGVGLGHKIKNGEDTGKPCLSIMVNQKLDSDLLRSQDKVPSKVNDAATDVVQVGDIFAGGGDVTTTPELGTALEQDVEIEDVGSLSLRQRIRPAMGGFSVGHYRITAGTLGTCCYDITPFPSIPRKYYILSNNHVLANSNDARIGDPILQPGPYDGGSNPRDLIARLTRFVPIRWKTATGAPCNYVDAAIAEGNFHDLSREIYWIGYVKDLYVEPKVGDIVEKTGRTTNFSTGRVTALNATVDVNYGRGRIARFCRQIVTTNMSAGGDSGSLVLDLDERAVGLLFAGSSSATIVNNISYVQRLLRVRLHEK